MALGSSLDRLSPVYLAPLAYSAHLGALAAADETALSHQPWAVAVVASRLPDQALVLVAVQVLNRVWQPRVEANLASMRLLRPLRAKAHVVEVEA